MDVTLEPCVRQRNSPEHSARRGGRAADTDGSLAASVRVSNVESSQLWQRQGMCRARPWPTRRGTRDAGHGTSAVSRSARAPLRARSELRVGARAGAVGSCVRVYTGRDGD